ncbi:recombinase family protein [Halomarina ordinaria]|uniref:Recombinase family protein n=1 Tax=Halomarina ordinaria TaxID=3033939 RepID=A0ABD5UDB0_9EURY|nr:recombinase family protein [Halomarina sp. PSRA2]
MSCQGHSGSEDSSPLPESDDDDTSPTWITPDPDQVDVVRDMFEHFLEHQNYQRTADHLAEQYGHRGIRPTRGQVSNLLQRPVYIGKPTMNVDSSRVDDKKVVVDDADLAIVDEQLYTRVQNVIAAKTRTYSQTNETVEPTDFVDLIGIDGLVNVAPNLQLHCPACGSVDLVKNGVKQTGEISVQNYQCNECDRQSKWPDYRTLQGIAKELEQFLEEMRDE